MIFQMYIPYTVNESKMTSKTYYKYVVSSLKAPQAKIFVFVACFSSDSYWFEASFDAYYLFFPMLVGVYYLTELYYLNELFKFSKS